MSAEIRSIAALRADRENDNSLISPIECLEDAAQDIRMGKRVCQKLLVITLDQGEDGRDFKVGFYASNLRASEIVSITEVMKIRALKFMGCIPED